MWQWLQIYIKIYLFCIIVKLSPYITSSTSIPAHTICGICSINLWMSFDAISHALFLFITIDKGHIGEWIVQLHIPPNQGLVVVSSTFRIEWKQWHNICSEYDCFSWSNSLPFVASFQHTHWSFSAKKACIFHWPFYFISPYILHHINALGQCILKQLPPIFNANTKK